MTADSYEFEKWVRSLPIYYGFKNTDKAHNWLHKIISKRISEITYFPDNERLFLGNEEITAHWLAKDINKPVNACERALTVVLSELAGSKIDYVNACPAFGKLDLNLVEIDGEYFDSFNHIPAEICTELLPFRSLKKSANFDNFRKAMKKYLDTVDDVCGFEQGTTESVLMFPALKSRRLEFFQLQGAGGNGKGTFASILARLYENECVITNSFPSQSGHAELKRLHDFAKQRVVYFEDVPDFGRPEFEKIKGWSTAQHVDVKTQTDFKLEKFHPVFFVDSNYVSPKYDEEATKRRLVSFDFGKLKLSEVLSKDELNAIWSATTADVIYYFGKFAQYDYSKIEIAKTLSARKVSTASDERALFIEAFGHQEQVRLADFRAWLKLTGFERRLVESFARGADVFARDKSGKRVRLFENLLFERPAQLENKKPLLTAEEIASQL